MKNNWPRPFAVVCVLILATGLSLSTWKMLQFRDRLHAITENDRWEKTLSAYRSRDDNLIVFFGDSQIALWSMAPSFGTLPIINRGKSGDWALRAVDRFEQDVIDNKPRSLVMLIGTNDLGNGQSIDAIIGSIEAMVQKATNHGIRVILCSLLPVRGEYTTNHQTKDILSLNSRMATLALHYKADYLDFYTALRDDHGLLGRDFTSDGLHPNTAGYLRMSHIILPFLIKDIVRDPR